MVNRKIGIVCDWYKLDMFKAELAAENIEIQSVKTFTSDPTTGKPATILISVMSQQYIVGPITDRVTRHFIKHPYKP